MGSIAVLGGGIAGLSAAFYLKAFAPNTSLRLFEASPHLGGWIKSSRSPRGHVFEGGPHTLRPRGEPGENTLRLLELLGLQDEVVPIPRDHPAALNRLVCVKGSLHALPSNIMSLLRVMPPFSKPIILAILHDLRAPRKKLSDESIYDFTARRFGEEIAEFAVSPLICGICAGDAKEISVHFLMQSMFESEQQHGSVVKGMLQNFLMKRKVVQQSNTPSSPLVEQYKKEKWSVYSLKGGLETLTKALAGRLQETGTDFLLRSACQSITFHSNKVIIRTKDKDYEVDQVISALPAHQLAPLLKDQHPILSEELQSIPFVDVGVVNLQFRGQVLGREAFGFLVPPSQKLPILGMIFDSCCFPSQGDTVITAMMGGKWFQQQFGQNPSPNDLLKIALQQARTILGITQEVESSHVSILHKCIPQYVIGHHNRVVRINSYIKMQKLPLAVCGSSYEGVGVNDAIVSAKQAVKHLRDLCI